MPAPARTPANVVPFVRDPFDHDETEQEATTILGKLSRKDFELWVCHSPGGAVSLKWWRWSDDAETFSPLEDGALTLSPAELKPLSDLLISVGNVLKKKGL